MSTECPGCQGLKHRLEVMEKVMDLALKTYVDRINEGMAK